MMFFKKISLCILSVVISYAAQSICISIPAQSNTVTKVFTGSPSQKIFHFEVSLAAPVVKNDVSCFLPVTKEWQQDICTKLKFDFSNPCVQGEICKPLNIPSKTINIKGDGNCFFTALSLWITGSDKYKHALRSTLFMRNSERISLMMDPKQELNEYLDTMAIDGQYANFYELYAAAEMLKTSIYVYSREEWQFISKDGVGGQEMVDGCLYMLHINNNHFEVVVDVEDK
ncbi:uncharacterized protein LOC126838681 isoform X2 [Adelges cooleyi]|uniref:uncharacterized protein LOC126838681 isoform X2 n=1 Tax=Adelges cooleyi TaxID=133065 RepID=UPI00217F90C4|nr:uncharacterized protein LOC126838681 isoform X2 [Adelges cooleyi]